MPYNFYLAHENALKRLAAKYGDADENNGEILDRLPRLLELYDETKGALVPYVMTNLRWYLHKKRAKLNKQHCSIDSVPEPSYLHQADTIGVRELLQPLNERDRWIVYLKVVEGYTFKELSTKLNVHEKTVLKRYHRAIAKLR